MRSPWSPRQIRSDKLRPEHVPDPESDWDRIQQFALTFNGYDHWGSLDRCAEIANARDPKTLTELRTCLFFEQRRWRHFGEVPGGEDMAYIRGLVAGIREAVTAR